jgi:hypothetical protein
MKAMTVWRAQLIGGRADGKAVAEGRGLDSATLCTTDGGGIAASCPDEGESSNSLR